MSRESSKWLNTLTLIGFTLKRGFAWHYREEDQGNESNHYDGAIPQDDVIRRLFNFSVIEAPMHYYFNGELRVAEDRKLMVADDTGDVLGVFKSGYQGHSYKEWLLNQVGQIIDTDLAIGSAGLLRNRAQAWVSVEMPENMTAAGVEFRPHLLACTSFDGSLATTYKRCIQFVVCDNTLSAGLGEAGQIFKARHSKYSGIKLNDVRSALEIVHAMGDSFAEELERLAAWKVSEKQFEKHLNLVVPIPEDKGRGQTIATKKQAEIIHLYRADERAATWRGSALGVLQAHNTWNHHFASVRKGVARGQRNMENVVTDKFATADKAVLEVLQTVTA